MTIPQQTSSSPVDVLAQTESFRTLDRPTLELLIDTADIDQVASGRTLFQIGEPFGQVVYILYAGHMRKRRRSGEEEEAHIGAKHHGPLRRPGAHRGPARVVEHIGW